MQRAQTLMSASNNCRQNVELLLAIACLVNCSSDLSNRLEMVFGSCVHSPSAARLIFSPPSFLKYSVHQL
jgi:hypothetical protein